MELRIRDLCKSYPNGVQALKDVTLTIPGGAFGLLGPRGAGKSTLMRILAGREEPDAGSVHLEASPEQLLLVDEPGPGFDPRALADDRIVVLATRHAADVSACTRIAIINDGRVLLEDEPRHAIGDLLGRIWSRVIAREAVPKVQRDYAVVSMKVIDGETVVRVYSNVAPAVGFERVQPDLDDVYASALAGYLHVRALEMKS